MAGEELLALVRRTRSAACILVALPSGRIRAVSASVAPLLGVETDAIIDRPLAALMRNLWRSEPMRLLVAGAQSGFACATTFRAAHGELVNCTVAARHLQTPVHRWVFVMVEVDRVSMGGTGLLHQSDDAEVVVGVGDGEGGIHDVSPNIEGLLGYDPATFVSRSVAGLIHADDFPTFTTSATTAMAAGRTTSFLLRMRHADGSWAPVRLLLAPLGATTPSRLAFVLLPRVAEAGDDGAADGARLEEVEQRLRRIALEIAALGITEGLGPDMAPEVALALGRLSPKRQEIVARLQDGQRVPTIAEEMFLSQSTIRNHLSATFRHFSVASQEELVRLLRGARS